MFPQSDGSKEELAELACEWAIASACSALDKLIESGNDEAFSKFVHLYVPVNHHDHAGTDV
jgi:hypothetical protein